MKFFLNLALPALALAAVAIQPRQAPVVEMISASSLGDNACDAGFLGSVISQDKTTMTLIFDHFRTFVEPNNQEVRERFCAWEVQVKFPLGCTKGSATIQPRGFVRLPAARWQAKFHSEVTMSPFAPGQSIAQAPDTIYNGPIDDNTLQEQRFGVAENIRNENERVVKFTARTRIFLASPGGSDTAEFSLDSIDLRVFDLATC